MSEKRAVYNGPSGTGVDLLVELSDGQLRPCHVDQGGQLPAEIGGVKVSAAFRDGLLEQDDWKPRKQATGDETNPPASSRKDKE